MTIEARIAIDSGAAASSSSSTASREARWREIAAVLRHQAAEVDDPPHAGAAAAAAKCSAAARSRSANSSGRPLHRVDQEVGDLDAVERAVEARARERVALDHLVGRRATRAAERLIAADAVAAARRRGTRAAPT